MKDLKSLFYPESIAVVGASEKKLKWGFNIISNILDNGFEGKVYPVTSSGDTNFNLPAYRSLKDIDDTIDLVFIVTPANTVESILTDCTEKCISNIIIVTSGFSETGDEGTVLENRIIEYSEKNNLNVIGPNTMGIANTWCSLFATGSHPKPPRGGISIIAQSGNVGNQIMLWAELQNIGISKFIGSGNEAVLKCEDFLEYLNNDDDTTVILMYLEGVDDGRKFLDIAKKTSFKKPVIALKAGRTETGSKAALSHTGAMAGSTSVFKGALHQSGIIEAKNPTELLTLSSAFDAYPLPKGNRVGVLTLGGGWGVITADECEEQGLVLPKLPDDIKDKLDAMLPPFWSRANPVDLVGTPSHEMFNNSIEIMMSTDAFDAVIVLGIIGSFIFGMRPVEASHRLGLTNKNEVDFILKAAGDLQDTALDNILALMEKYERPILPVSLAMFPGDDMIYQKEGCKYKAIVYKTPEDATLCLARMYEYYKYFDRRK